MNIIQWIVPSTAKLSLDVLTPKCYQLFLFSVYCVFNEMLSYDCYNLFHFQSTRLMDEFLALSKSNTEKDLETCGILGAYLVRFPPLPIEAEVVMIYICIHIIFVFFFFFLF